MSVVLCTLLLLLSAACTVGAKVLPRPTEEERLYRIIGGVTADDDFAPYLVSIQNSNSSEHVCGGAILSYSWILTAAHCLKNVRKKHTSVVSGTRRWSQPGARHHVKKVFRHPDYVEGELHDDVALLHLKGDIIYNKKTKPLRLPIGETKESDGEVQLAGWGSTPDDLQPDIKHKIRLKFVARENCSALLKPHSPLYSGNVCTFTRRGEGACIGDSGGPIVAKGRLVGVVNWGEPCARGYADVHASAFFYKTWIRETMKSN